MWSEQISRQGLLIVISGPSGSGKTSVVKALCQADPALTHSISATTRPRRPDEVNGVNYHFLSSSEFDELVMQDGFLESAKYGEHYYGTLRSEVEPKISEGKNVVVEIDVHGGMQVKELPLKHVCIFILPPSFTVLEKRLRGRKTESGPELQQRLQRAQSEIVYMKYYDFYVVNFEDCIDQAVQKIRAIITAEHSRIDDQLFNAISQEFSPSRVS
ncbi:MAG: guanylate kinase [Candidatus Poribacteria bacterium]|nr:guanylate kinase [Candidatus Poribacteria bacterium]